MTVRTLDKPFDRVMENFSPFSFPFPHILGLKISCSFHHSWHDIRVFSYKGALCENWIFYFLCFPMTFCTFWDSLIFPLHFDSLWLFDSFCSYPPITLMLEGLRNSWPQKFYESFWITTTKHSTFILKLKPFAFQLLLGPGDIVLQEKIGSIPVERTCGGLTSWQGRHSRKNGAWTFVWIATHLWPSSTISENLYLRSMVLSARIPYQQRNA